MSFVGDILGSLTGSKQQAEAATQSAGIQDATAREGIRIQDATARYGIDSNNAQFAQLQQLLAPFVNAGVGALGQQQNILGLNGAGAQQGAYDSIKASPAYTSALQSGETSILQNASATGGLRGGNTQAALAQFSPALLTQLIQQQYGNLGGLTSLGQNAAAGTGNAGMSNSANNSALLQQSGAAQAALLQQSGAAQAGGVLAAGNATANNFNTIGQLGGFLSGGGGTGLVNFGKTIAGLF